MLLLLRDRRGGESERHLLARCDGGEKGAFRLLELLAGGREMHESARRLAVLGDAEDLHLTCVVEEEHQRGIQVETADEGLFDHIDADFTEGHVADLERLTAEGKAEDGLVLCVLDNLLTISVVLEELGMRRKRNALGILRLLVNGE